MKNPETISTPQCEHCGDICPTQGQRIEEFFFCCGGCKMVYQLLHEQGMSQFYTLNKQPGNAVQADNGDKFTYLDEPTIKDQLTSFSNGHIANLNFFIPGIHCASCVWLLEHLNRLNGAIFDATVNFSRRELQLTYYEEQSSLRDIVVLLSSLGYDPQLKQHDQEKTNAEQLTEKKSSNQLMRLGIAGFCFANTMLFSLPHYMGYADMPEKTQQFFYMANIFLCFPAAFYCATPFFQKTIAAFKQRRINMDVPIALGIITLFARSLYDVLNHAGAGYADSLCGLIFLLLVGRHFQKKTFDALSFDNDLNDFLPIYATRINEGLKTSIPVSQVKPQDKLLIRNSEVIVVDGNLLSQSTLIDYSFVTGESDPVVVKQGELIYAGGRQVGAAIEVTARKAFKDSNLLRLWHRAKQSNANKSLSSLAQHISPVFLITVIALALAGALYWHLVGAPLEQVFNVFTSVLIIACPCALALSAPFSLGTTSRLMAKLGFYLKDASSIECLSQIDTLVFDKTGTLSQSQHDIISYPVGIKQEQLDWVIALANHSIHPFSQSIATLNPHMSLLKPSQWQEVLGQGITGHVDGHQLCLGSYNFICDKNVTQHNDKLSQVWLSIDGQVMGFFGFSKINRAHMAETLLMLRKNYPLHLLSGDDASDHEKLSPFFGNDQLHFKQSPQDKFDFIETLKHEKSAHPLMIGDGLNDAGALKASDIGIALSENTSQFSPACDGILDAKSFDRLPALLKLAKQARQIIIISFTLSLLYNVIGVGIALTGNLSPLLSAIFMPVSSITIMLFTTVTITWLAKSACPNLSSQERSL